MEKGTAVLNTLENVSELDKAEDGVDPRIQIELERLNSATDAINRLEVDLDDGRAAFRHLLIESTAKIDQLAKRLGNCIEKARPYYEARMRAKEALQETQKAAVRFERANSAHVAAKEMVALAEEGLKTEGRIFDHAWQEMLNHATMRVNEAETERSLSEEEHRRTSLTYQLAEKKVQDLQRELKKNIVRSSRNARRSLLQLSSLAYQHQLLLLPYFEMKAHFNQLMEEQKRRVRELEEKVTRSKLSYADALCNLERISDEIHQHRQERKTLGIEELGARSAGVGAESPVSQRTSEQLPDDFTGGGATDDERLTFLENQILHPLMDEYYDLPPRLHPSLSPPSLNKTISATAYDKEEFKGIPNSFSKKSATTACSPTSNSDSTDSKESVLSTSTFQKETTRVNIQKGTVHGSSTKAIAGAALASLTNSQEEEQIRQASSKTSSKFREKKMAENVPTELEETETLLGITSLDRDDTGTVVDSAPTVCIKGSALLTLELPADETDMSDSESLASVDVLNDDQIACLMLDQELRESYDEVLATPVAEETPLIPN